MYLKWYKRFECFSFWLVQSKPKQVFWPCDWLRVDQCCIRHNLHPGLHFFGCVSAEIVRPHVWMRRLVVKNQHSNLRGKKSGRWIPINTCFGCPSCVSGTKCNNAWVVFQKWADLGQEDLSWHTPIVQSPSGVCLTARLWQLLSGYYNSSFTTVNISFKERTLIALE